MSVWAHPGAGPSTLFCESKPSRASPKRAKRIQKKFIQIGPAVWEEEFSDIHTYSRTILYFIKIILSSSRWIRVCIIT